jgi:uncharacterized protein (TIGR02270 family)
MQPTSAELEGKASGQPDESVSETAEAASKLEPMGCNENETSTVIQEIIEQHAEEAAFLWTTRDQAVLSPSYYLKDLSALDERIEAHLDGVRIAGLVGWQVCEKALEQEERGRVFAAGVLAVESGDTGRICRVLDVACSTPELERELISALGWIRFNQAETYIKELLNSETSAIRSIGIAAFAAHRSDPGESLTQALSDPDARLRARALKACGELGKANLLPLILKSISDQDEMCRFFAAWSAARLGDRSPQLVQALQEIALGDSEYAERALDIAFRIMSVHEAKSWYQHLRKESAQVRAAVTAAGIIGTPDLVTDLIDLMKIPSIARLAGRSFAVITGVNLAYENLSGDKPEQFEAGPTENVEDDNVTMDPDQNLPWPEAPLVAKWWNQRRVKFQTGRRYLTGKEISTQSLRKVLIERNQSERAAAALELAVNDTARPLFEVRARAALQIEELKTEYS